MNIFVLDNDPKKAAQYHSDKHCVKMILESAQMLSTAHHVLDEKNAPKEIYRKSFVNHPCTVWTRQNSANYRWHFQLFVALMKNYSLRYKRKHASERLIPLLKKMPKKIKKTKEMSPFAQAMPEKFRNFDAVKAYRTYYFIEKKDINVWNHSQIPEWYQEKSNEK